MKNTVAAKKTPGRRSPANLPVTLTRHRTYMLPTRHGMLFFFALLAMLVGAINYNNNLGFLLVFLLGAMALVSMLHTHRNLVGLRLLSVSANPVFAGETAVFDFLVYSESVMRRALVFSIEKAHQSSEDAAPGIVTRIPVRVTTRERGIFRPGPVTVYTRFPLGLFYTWCTLRMELSCVVYPKPLAGPFQVHEGTADGAKTEGSGILEGTDDFMGMKTYQPGDPVRRISWKAFSRGQGLFTKEFGGRGQTILIFDYNAIKSDDTEKKLSRLCDLVTKAARTNIEYGLRLPETFIPPGRGEQHKHQCLKALALSGKKEKGI
ncbi:MAG: DUF58 domain-containing protein [Desulfobacteraceae bacterium]|nr:DUF58 domain-containing protein [Desulfobacteraceae bacterium]